MKNIKILLGDPRHYTVGPHSNYVPINIGYIGSYLLKKINNIEVELKLAVTPDEIFKITKNWKPDVIGMSNYCWNAELSNLICENAKKLNSNTLCILGGPEFPAGTGARKIINTSKEPTYDKCLNYLLERPTVDYFAFCDGETTFVELVENFIKNNFSVKLMKANDDPIKGCASVSNNKKKLLVGEYINRLGMEGSIKSEGRDVIPSPYLSGLLDKFLDGKMMAAFETARGCPFLCTFCDQGLDESKITAFSSKRLAQEMMYVGEKISKIEKGSKTISIFDSNWGLFEKDLELADEIAKVMEKYDWPQYIFCSTPKNKRENLLKINDKLKNRVSVGLAMQSMDGNVLSNIKRKNLDYEKQINHIKEIQKRDKQANTELIIPLPGESKKTYFEGLKFLMDNNVMTSTYTLMMLCGAELGRDEAIDKFKIQSRFRILPKQFGDYSGKKVFEIEQVCVGTNTMSYDDYLDCRNFSFFVRLFAQQIFTPIHKLTKKLGISWFYFIKEIYNIVKNKDFSGKLKDIYEGFCLESHQELFNSKEDAIKFYSKQKNYDALVQGDVGENLSEKYTSKAILAFQDILTTVFYVLENKLINENKSELISILKSGELWLKNLYMIEEIFNDKKKLDELKCYELDINFDFPSWIKDEKLSNEEFQKRCRYMIEYDSEKINYFRNEKKSIFKSYNENRALSRFIRAHMSKGPVFFEKKIKQIH